MKRYVLVSSIALLAMLPASGDVPIRLAQATLPTLEDVVFIESGVDRNAVFLGEAITLSLTYGELKFRGIRVQNYYKTTQAVLPETEGFVAGAIREEVREVTRDGFTYALTTHQVPLYPTRAGELFIGAWRWQGTARGYTGDGARSLNIDKRTDPITITVRPLPPAPPGFGGAVGEFSLSADLEETELTQGVPTTLHVDIEGTGNLQALRPPVLPQALWYRFGDPVAGQATAMAGRENRVSKRFSYSLLPLQEGGYSLGPITWSYFSPDAGDYVELTAPAMVVRVQPSGIDEQLVVAGGVGREGLDGLMVMDAGRLPLVTVSGPLAPRWSWEGYLGLMGIIPIGIFITVLIFLRLLFRQNRSGFHPAATERLNRALTAGEPVTALRFAIMKELEGLMGQRGAGMTAPEMEAALAERGWGDTAQIIGGALRQCEALRYGGATAEPDALAHLAARAGAALENARAREGSQ